MWDGLLTEGRDSAHAIGGPGQAPLTYARLRRAASETVATLNAKGIGRNDRVASIVENGPIAASLFLSVGAGAAYAPLDPGRTEAYFARDFDRIKPKAVIVQEYGSFGPAATAAKVARDKSIPIVALKRPDNGAAGEFTLDFGSAPNGAAAHPGHAVPTDETLLLQTSGTTGEPKLVPLSQGNVSYSAGSIGRNLKLSASDRLLSFMGLFHIHGLIAGVLAPVRAGGFVYCAPVVNRGTIDKFFGWFADAKPTWITGVATMHQMIVAESAKPENQAILRELGGNVRVVRASSMSLPPAVLEDLERIFPNAVAVEAAGGTEASHEWASNPPDRSRRKPGSVGFPTGAKIKLVDANTYEEVPVGKQGLIALQGPGVFGGYPEDKTKDFVDGWFVNGDEGIFDAEGYLYLKGRTKEMINRGGESIPPIPIDHRLVEHPAVAEAAACPLPDPKLGEIVAAAVVLAPGASVDVADLQKWVAQELPRTHVPARIGFVSALPKTASGKLDRKNVGALITG